MNVKKILIAGITTAFALSVSAATVNVKDMGAVGNGQTDDWTAIQAALSQGGGDSLLTVVVPDGTYLVSKTLSVFSNTTLQLASNATIVVNDGSWMGVLRGQHRTAAGRDCPMDATCPHGGYSQLKNVKIAGGTWYHKGANGGDAYVIQLQHSDGITLENMSCKGNVRHHFNCSGSKNVVVRNVTFLPSDDHPYVIPTDELDLADMRLREAIHVDFVSNGTELAYPLDDTPCRDITVTDCTFDRIIAGVGTHRHYNADGTTDAVSMLAERIVVTNCTFNSILSYAMSMYGFDDSSFVCNQVVCDPQIEHAPGVRVNGVGSVRVSDNTISGSASHGIIVESLDGELLTVLAERNVVESSGLRGISVSGSRVSAVLNDNTVNGTASHGIFVYDGASLSARGNTLVNIGDCAIAAVGAGTKLDFSGGSVVEAGVDGVRAKSNAEVIVSDSTFAGVGQYGVLVQDGVVATISRCTFDSPAKAGVFLDNPSACLVEGNLFEGAGGSTYAAVCAISATSPVARAIQILGNIITSSNSSAIYVKWSSGVDVVGNVIAGASGGGIFYNSSIGGLISSNTVTEVATFGIHVAGDESTLASAAVIDNSVATAAGSTIADVSIGSYSEGCTVSGNICGHNGVAISPSSSNVTYRPANATVSSVEVTSMDSAIVRWQNMPGITDYIVEYSSSPSFADVRTVAATDGTGQCVISGLSSATTWYVVVRSHHRYYGVDYYSYATADHTYDAAQDAKYVKDFVVTADSDAIYYSVHFDGNGATAGDMADQSGFVYGRAGNLSVNAFTRVGYVFAGWATSASSSAVAYADGASLTSPSPKPEIGGTVTLYAVWAVDTTKYTIHFDGNGATSGTMADQRGFTPGKGDVALRANAFVRAGYRFLGWSKNAKATTPYWLDGAVINTSTVAGSTLTIYAIWERDANATYTVAFNANGGSGTMAAQADFVPGVERALPANKFTQAGYRFLGWALDIDATAATYADGAMFVSDTASGGTVTLYAVWSPDPTKTYNVHFDGNGATGGEMADQPGFVPGNGGRRLNLNQFTRTGYNFLGWSKFPKATTPTWIDGAVLNTSTSIGTTLTLYAVWQYNPGRTYTVAFDANGGTGEMADQIDFVNGEVRELAPNAFVRDGYVFKGWSRSLTASSATYADGAPITNSSPNVAVGHTMTLFAVWEVDATCCTAHFDANGGEGEMADQLGFRPGEARPLAANAFVRPGYVFAGWALSPEAGSVLYPDGGDFATDASLTLYAAWAVDTTKYTVRFDGNGATAGEMADQLGFNPGKGGVNLNVNRFVRPGYKFWGWSNFPKSAATKWTDGQTLVTSTAAGATLTVYAIWQAADDTYSILFDANGGTGTMPMQQGVASGVPTALTASAFTREGYAFKGWARSPSTTSVAYADGAAVSLPAAAFDDATLKLYAVWEPLANYTVVFNKNDGTAAKTSKTYKPGVRVQLPRATIPSGLDWAREGYAFKGWAYSSGATIAVIDDWTVVQDLAAAGETVNLYGVWSPLDTVTFDMQGGGGGTTFVNAERDDLLPRIKTLPSRYGFVFQGYFSAPDGAGTRYYNADGTGTQVWDGTGDATLYASWVSDGKFTVVLHKNDGTGVEHVVVVEEGKGVALPGGASDLKWAPRRGFTYMGWSDSEKSKVVKFKDKENMRAYFKAGEVVHVYAIWQLNLATSYAIQYIRNDGSGSVRTIGFVGGVDTKLNSVAALGFARRGYDFGGWATSTENARNKVVWRPDMGTVSQPIANGKLLPVYAIWTLKAGFYSIRFNKNDGSGKWRELGYEYGKNTTLPTIVNGLGWGRDGYTFVGWATSKANADAGTIWRGDAGITKTPIAAGRTLSLYAVWRVSAASAVASAPSGASVTSAGNASMVRERTWIEPALEVGETCLHGVLTDGGTYDLIVDANGTTGYARIETATDVVASECAVDAGEEILTARLEDGTVLVVLGDGSAVVE